jgi:hypothetical protein
MFTSVAGRVSGEDDQRRVNLLQRIRSEPAAGVPGHRRPGRAVELAQQPGLRPVERHCRDDQPAVPPASLLRLRVTLARPPLRKAARDACYYPPRCPGGVRAPPGRGA